MEYCNYKGGTYYSDLRAKNGHPQPYGVKIWDLGNEVDGLPWELGHKNAEDYVETAREAAKAMTAVDPTIKFVGSGSSYYYQQVIGLIGTVPYSKASVIKSVICLFIAIGKVVHLIIIMLIWAMVRWILMKK